MSQSQRMLPPSNGPAVDDTEMHLCLNLEEQDLGTIQAKHTANLIITGSHQNSKLIGIEVFSVPFKEKRL